MVILVRMEYWPNSCPVWIQELIDNLCIHLNTYLWWLFWTIQLIIFHLVNNCQFNWKYVMWFGWPSWTEVYIGQHIVPLPFSVSGCWLSPNKAEYGPYNCPFCIWEHIVSLKKRLCMWFGCPSWTDNNVCSSYMSYFEYIICYLDNYFVYRRSLTISVIIFVCVLDGHSIQKREC